MMHSCMRQGVRLTAGVRDWHDAFSSQGAPRDEIALPMWANTKVFYNLESKNSPQQSKAQMHLPQSDSPLRRKPLFRSRLVGCFRGLPEMSVVKEAAVASIDSNSISLGTMLRSRFLSSTLGLLFKSLSVLHLPLHSFLASSQHVALYPSPVDHIPFRVCSASVCTD